MTKLIAAFRNFANALKMPEKEHRATEAGSARKKTKNQQIWKKGNPSKSKIRCSRKTANILEKLWRRE